MERLDRSALHIALRSAKARYERNRDYLIKGKVPEFRPQVLLINPILMALGWDVLDPNKVRLEEVAGDDDHRAKPRPDSPMADYALYAPGPVCAGVVEAKSLSVHLMRKDRQVQADNYARELRSTWVILTNGLLWRGWICGDEEMGENCFLEVSLTSDPIEECCERILSISYEAALDLCRKSGSGHGSLGDAPCR